MGIFSKKETEDEFSCGTVFYNGGHTLHLSKMGLFSPMGPGGDLSVKKDMLIFRTSNKKIEINMPLNKINFREVRSHIGSRGSTQQAVAFAGSGMALGSLGAMAKDLFVEISFIDENGKKQKPIFEFTGKKKAEKFQKWLYGKIPSELETLDNPNERPLEILKIRYAKGEISKKEYEKMKKDF